MGFFGMLSDGLGLLVFGLVYDRMGEVKFIVYNYLKKNK